MRICLFEDVQAAAFEPLTLTRPVFDLPYGVGTVASRLASWAGAGEGGVFVRPEIEAIFRESHPGVPVNDTAWLEAGPILLLNARWLPPSHDGFDSRLPALGIHRGEIAYAVLTRCPKADPDAPHLDSMLNRLRGTLPEVAAGGSWLASARDLTHDLARRIADDFRRVNPESCAYPPAGMTVVGPSDRLRIDATATVRPQVVADTTLGPVVIQKNAVIEPFSRLVGPCVIGPRSLVRGGCVEGSIVGADCFIAGEIEGTVLGCGSRVQVFATLRGGIVGAFVEVESGARAAGIDQPGLIAGDYATLAANGVAPAGTVLDPGAEWHGSAIHAARLPLFHTRREGSEPKLVERAESFSRMERRAASAGRIVGEALRERLVELWEKESRLGRFAAGESQTGGLRVAVAG